MTNKELKDKAIDIKGKQYVLVSDRIIYFNEKYENGSIITALVSKPDADMVVVKAKVTPDAKNPERYFTGYSQATWGDGMVNKTAALENAETSAVGRALAMMGIGVIDSVASADEMNKAGGRTTKEVAGGTVSTYSDKPSAKQLALLKKNGVDGSKMTKKEASKVIGKIFDGTFKPQVELEKKGTISEAGKMDLVDPDEVDIINPDDIPF